MTPTKTMHKSKVLIIIGTRPEAIKMVPLILAFKESKKIEPIVISTGQHSEMVNDVLALAGLIPDVDLHAATPGNSLNTLFSSVMTKLEAYCINTFGDPADLPASNSPKPTGYPSTCFVHGDTTSAAAGALAAFHMRIPVAHIEAGLRTSNTLSPFPEELNRQLVSRIATFHLAPTFSNKSNLVLEGVPFGQVFVCGNTAIDALAWAASLGTSYGHEALADLEEDEHTKVVAVTAHRRENWGGGIHRIATAIATLADNYPDVRFVVSVHPNPKVKQAIETPLMGHTNVSLVPPMPYIAFARLLKRAYLVVTDSGGIQEEAPAVGTPVIVMRDSTERQEGVKAGTLELVGTDSEKIIQSVSALLNDQKEHDARVARKNPYGDGFAAERIVAASHHIAFNDPAPVPYGFGFERVDVLTAAGFYSDPAGPDSGLDPVESMN